MHASGAVVYTFLVFGLYLKSFVLIAIQGSERRRSAVFRWPEDASAWDGRVQPEGQRVERAQAALRNASESEPLFMAASAVWIALGAPQTAALVVCLGYVLVRALHAYLLLVPRQPLRTRVFGLSQLLLLGVSVEAVRLAWLTP